MDDAFDRSKNLEQLALLWLDTENIVNNELEIRMRAIIDYFKFFNHADECNDYLSSTHQAKVFVIISSNYNKRDQIQHFLTSAHQFKHVHAVYVYLTDENNERAMDMDYPKVGDFSDSLNNTECFLVCSYVVYTYSFKNWLANCVKRWQR